MSAAAFSLAGLSGCLVDTRRTTSGRIRADAGRSKLCPADEQYVNGSFPDDTGFRGWLFSGPSVDQWDMFTNRAMQRQYSSDLLEADGGLFVLLFKVRMSREDVAFYNTAFSPPWTGWHDASIPIRRPPSADPEVFEVDVNTLVYIRLPTSNVVRGAAPTNAALRVFERDDESGTTHGFDPEQTVAIYRAGRWADRQRRRRGRPVPTSVVAPPPSIAGRQSRTSLILDSRPYRLPSTVVSRPA